jgi:hypothetical protein
MYVGVRREIINHLAIELRQFQNSVYLLDKII